MAFFNCQHCALFNCSTETNSKHVKGSVSRGEERWWEAKNNQKNRHKMPVYRNEFPPSSVKSAAGKMFKNAASKTPKKRKNNANLSNKCNAHAHKFAVFECRGGGVVCGKSEKRGYKQKCFHSFFPAALFVIFPVRSKSAKQFCKHHS